MEERGIILTHQMKLDNQTNRLSFGNSEGAIPAAELRKHLLYWDFIDFPKTSHMGIELGTSEDNKLLIEQGYIRQTDLYIKKKQESETPWTFDVNKICEDAIIGQIEVLNEYAKKNIRCAISQFKVDPQLVNLYIPKAIQKERSVVEFGLIDILPYPNIDTKIEDILEFKERRKNELTQLRKALDQLTTKAIQNPLQNETTRKELEKSISDIHTLLKESKINISTITVNVLVDIMEDIFISSVYGYPIEIKGLVTKALITTFKKVVGPTNLPENCKDYAYIFNVNKEL